MLGVNSWFDPSILEGMTNGEQAIAIMPPASWPPTRTLPRPFSSTRSKRSATRSGSASSAFSPRAISA